MAFTPPTSLGVGGVAVAVTQGTSPWVVGDGGGSLTVDGPLTDAELRASAVPVSGTVAVTAESLPLPDGAATDETLGDVAATAARSATALALLGGALDVDLTDVVDDGS